MGALRLAQEPGGGAARSVVAGGSAQALRGVVLPFVFRRYLDYSVFEALRLLHRQIREHAARRAPAGPSAPTTSSSRAAASARSSSSCSCCRWCAAASSPSCAPAPRCRRCSGWPRAGLMTPETARRRWPRPTSSCAASSTASSTWTTSRPMCCPWAPRTTRTTATWAGSPAPWATPTVARSCTSWTRHREFVATEFDKLLGEPHDLQGLQWRQERRRPAAAGPGDPAGAAARAAARARAHAGASSRACRRCATTPASGWRA